MLCLLMDKHGGVFYSLYLSASIFLKRSSRRVRLHRSLLSRALQVVVVRGIGMKLSSVIHNCVKRKILQLWQTARLGVFSELEIVCDTWRGFGRPAFPDARGRLSMGSPVGVLYSIVPLLSRVSCIMPPPYTHTHTHISKGPQFPFQCGPRDMCSSVFRALSGTPSLTIPIKGVGYKKTKNQ